MSINTDILFNYPVPAHKPEKNRLGKLKWVKLNQPLTSKDLFLRGFGITILKIAKLFIIKRLFTNLYNDLSEIELKWKTERSVKDCVKLDYVQISSDHTSTTSKVEGSGKTIQTPKFSSINEEQIARIRELKSEEFDRNFVLERISLEFPKNKIDKDVLKVIDELYPDELFPLIPKNELTEKQVNYIHYLKTGGYSRDQIENCLKPVNQTVLKKFLDELWKETRGDK